MTTNQKPPIRGVDLIENGITGRKVKKTPIISIFGYSKIGERVCVNVHRTYPYFYVPYPSNVPSSKSRGFFQNFKNELELCLESEDDVVHSIELVEGMPFYGYFSKECPFMKISLYNPHLVGKTAAILMSGKMEGGKRYQPYESHIPYKLQFLIDFNLYGFGSIDFFENSIHYYGENSANWLKRSENSARPMGIIHSSKRLSSSRIELSVVSTSIINQMDVDPSPLTVENEGTNFVQSLKNIWNKERIRREMLYKKTDFTQIATQRRLQTQQSEIQQLLHVKLSQMLKEKKKKEESESVKEGISWECTQIPRQTHLYSCSVEDITREMDWMRKGDEVVDEEKRENEEEAREIMEATQSMSSKKIVGRKRKAEEPKLQLQPLVIGSSHALNVDQESESRSKKPRLLFNAGQFVVFDRQDNNSNVGFIESIEDLHVKIRLFYGKENIPSQEGRLFDSNEVFASDVILSVPYASIISKCVVVILPQNHTITETETEIDDDDEKEGIASFGKYVCRFFYDPLRRQCFELTPEMCELFWENETSVGQGQTNLQYKNGSSEEESDEENEEEDEGESDDDDDEESSKMDLDDDNEMQFFNLPCSQVPQKRVIHNANLDSSPLSYTDLIELEYKPQPPTALEIGSADERDDVVMSEKKTQTQQREKNEKKKRQQLFEEDFLSVFILEIFVQCREGNHPDPYKDAVDLLCVHMIQKRKGKVPRVRIGVFSTSKVLERYWDRSELDFFQVFQSEIDMLKHFLTFVQAEDPDIVMGYEIQKQSFGYLLERYCKVLKCNISKVLARVKCHNNNWKANEIILNEYGRKKHCGFFIEGRIVLNLWRILRRMLSLKCYSLQKVYNHLFKRNLPVFSNEKLTQIYKERPGFLLELVLAKTRAVARICERLGIIERISEFSKIYGIEFNMVPYRGSQYKIESLLFRLLKPRGYIAFSANKQQVANQNPAECLALVMEPHSGLYQDPVAVLDFQSLYPSIIISHNICFSTCLGKINRNESSRLGVVPDYRGQLKELSYDMRKDLYISPNGVIFVKKHVRYGVLPKLLKEILDCRIMIKRSMKKSRKEGDTYSSSILDYKQEGLKMIANTTYGYTAAGYSGRMPNSDIADSIVQIGRELLESAVRHVERKYVQEKIRIVYGDTDSIFVLFPGYSRSDAFRIAREICGDVTRCCKSPILLKFEKIYQPSFMISKKRYVGYCYEDEKQEKPFLDSKGIETIRRDTCDAVNGILKRALEVFFSTLRLDKTKEYLLGEWRQLLLDNVSLKDYIFYKRVRVGSYSKNERSLLPPAAIIAARKMKKDHRKEPVYNQRVAYVVTFSHPHARLVDMILDPLDFVRRSKELSLHANYYITKQMVPALQRIFGLIKNTVRVENWFYRLPKKTKRGWKTLNRALDRKHYTIESYFPPKYCMLCEKGKLTEFGNKLCEHCRNEALTSSFKLFKRHQMLLNANEKLEKECAQCLNFQLVNRDLNKSCQNLHCEVMFQKAKVGGYLESSHLLLKEINDW